MLYEAFVIQRRSHDGQALDADVTASAHLRFPTQNDIRQVMIIRRQKFQARARMAGLVSDEAPRLCQSSAKIAAGASRRRRTTFDPIILQMGGQGLPHDESSRKYGPISTDQFDTWPTFVRVIVEITRIALARD